jgi:hypothetical protein
MDVLMSKSQLALVVGLLIVVVLLFMGLLGFGDNVKKAKETQTVTA